MSWVRSGLVLDISVALLQGQLARATHQHPQARLQEIREAKTISEHLKALRNLAGLVEDVRSEKKHEET